MIVVLKHFSHTGDEKKYFVYTILHELKFLILLNQNMSISASKIVPHIFNGRSEWILGSDKLRTCPSM